MNIDTSGIIALEELHKKLLLNDIRVSEPKRQSQTLCMNLLVSLCSDKETTMNFLQLTIACPKWEVIHKLKKTNFVERIEGRIFLSVGEAVDSCLENASKLPSLVTKVIVN